ncbi:unnamed protein product [Arctogadus glacialis]
MVCLLFTSGMLLQTSTSTASSDFTPVPMGSRRKQRTPRGGRNKRGKGSRDLDADTQNRLEDLQRRRTAETKEKLDCLEPGQKDTILEKILNRSPGMMFDVMSLLEEPLHPEHDGALPHWCTCSHCRVMDTDLEKPKITNPIQLSTTWRLPMDVRNT